VRCSWVKCSEGLSNRVFTIIRKNIYIIWFLCLYGCFFYHILSYSVGSIFYHCAYTVYIYIYGCMFFILLFNFINYVFLLSCMFCSGYSISLCRSVYCLCVNVYCTACHRVSTQLQLTKYIITITVPPEYTEEQPYCPSEHALSKTTHSSNFVEATSCSEVNCGSDDCEILRLPEDSIFTYHSQRAHQLSFSLSVWNRSTPTYCIYERCFVLARRTQ